MIIVTGYLKEESNNASRVKRSVVWRNGQLTGNQLAIQLLRISARMHKGKVIMWHNPVVDWINDPVAFGVLIIDVFEKKYLEIKSNERTTPPPCPEDAVC